MPSVADELNEKTVALIIKGVKVTPSVLAAAMRLYLAAQKQMQNQGILSRKVSIQELTGKDGNLESIQVTKENIKSFEKVAQRYGIEYALKRNSAAETPTYYVFFKAKDLEAMTAAFQEFTVQELKNEKRKKEAEKTKERTHEKMKGARQNQRENKEEKSRENDFSSKKKEREEPSI